jgi:hypothetical protein
MKCIHCGNDAKYSDRKSGHCPSCKRPFAFEPKTGDALTDVAFKAAIDRVSSGGTVRWTTDHLYYEVVRRMVKRRTPVAAAIVLGVLGAIAMIVGFALPPFFFVGAFLWVFALFAALASRHRLDRARFDLLWARWVAAHGAPPSLITRRDLPAAPPRRDLPSDIEEYSFDRAVITDRSETVDLLLANNFHFENNCAVLSIDGYPPQVFATVRAMLKKNPKLVVFALHDATLEGCLLAHRLTTSPDWFKGTARVVDVGLSPRHAEPFKELLQPRQGAFHPSPLLSDADNKWLERYTLELSVIPPDQLIKRLFRAMSTVSHGQTPSDVGDDAILYLHAGTLSTHASASDGGGDSFG